MTEQDTAQQEEIRDAEQPLEDAAHPFDTELDVPEDGPAGYEEDESTETDEEPTVEEALLVDLDDEPEADEEDVASEEVEVSSAEEEPGQAELEPAESEPELDAPARSTVEVMAIAEAIIFVSDEPITSKALGDIVGEDKETIQAAVEELQREYEERGGGLQIREIAGGWQIATRTQYHEEVRKFLKTRPSAKLSLAALETLAVIAYKQPVTVPEILEIRGVQSASAIKTLLEKRLIVTKGHKETVGRPMMYGTSKDFLIQFGLKDLTDLPSIEDFEDLVNS
jgi:segregation and condensation protein B